MTNAEHLIVGKQAEEHACNYLIKNGLKLQEKNFHCRLGEIDLIMQDNDFLVFIEVRFRQNQKFGDAIETVVFAKQQRIINAAHYYLQKKRLYDQLPCRFDVVALTKIKETFDANWIQNAFTL
jgi:putative endonuclease